MNYCRICNAPVSAQDAWVELRGLGRFWLCPKHKKDCCFMQAENGAWLYTQEQVFGIVVGYE
jgi:hypothetical protein